MKHFSLLLFALLATAFANAQEEGSFSVNLYGGYNFSDKVEFNNSYGYVEEAFQYGGGLEYFYFQNNSVEVKYLRSDMNMPLYGPLGTILMQAMMMVLSITSLWEAPLILGPPHKPYCLI